LCRSRSSGLPSQRIAAYPGLCLCSLRYHLERGLTLSSPPPSRTSSSHTGLWQRAPWRVTRLCVLHSRPRSPCSRDRCTVPSAPSARRCCWPHFRAYIISSILRHSITTTILSPLFMHLISTADIFTSTMRSTEQDFDFFFSSVFFPPVLCCMPWVLGSAKGNPVTVDIALLDASPNRRGSGVGL